MSAQAKEGTVNNILKSNYATPNIRCCIPGCNAKVGSEQIYIHPLPEDPMFRLTWLATIREVFPRLGGGIDNDQHGVCELHFLKACRWNTKKQKYNGILPAGKGGIPCKRKLLDFKALGICCLPGCKNDNFDTLTNFKHAWLPIPQKVFRNFKLRHSKLSKICKAHLDSSGLPNIGKLTEHRNSCLNTYLKDKLISPRPVEYIQPLYASTPQRTSHPPMFQNPASQIPDTIFENQENQCPRDAAGTYDFSAEHDRSTTPEASPPKKFRKN